MRRHPEVLAPIKDDASQFERCIHTVRQTLRLEKGVLLIQEQLAFSAPETKIEPRVFKQRYGQVTELQGTERTAASKRLAQDTKTEICLIAQPQDQEIILAGASISLALYRHRVTEELWVGKSDVLDGDVLSSIAVLKERVANDIYAYYGILVPRLTVARLTCCYRTADNQRIYGQEENIIQASHLMSRWLDRFNSYPAMPEFSTEKVPDHYKLLIDGQLIPEKGLGHVLAVAHFIHDVDVTNAAGRNIGYRLRTDEQGKLFAQTCKIDAGYAFHDVEDKSSPAYRVTQAMPFKTQQRECDYVPFAYFPRNTQAEFVATLADIIDTPPQDLGKFFHRDGAQALKSGGFATRAIAMLKARQLGLKTAFADELAAYHTQLAKIKQKEIKSDFPSLPPEVQPLYAQSLLESSNLIFQQAQHFYIEPGTTTDDHPESKQQPLSALLDAFLNNKEGQVLLLLGDSGLGKSTATQQLVQQQWQNYLHEDKQARIPLRIELNRFSERTVARCVDNVLLDDYHLSFSQISAFKAHPCFIILDGFDEVSGRIKFNPWDTNRLSEWRDVRLMVTCRNTYLNFEDRAKYFHPAGQIKGFQEHYLAPFGQAQIEKYLTKALTQARKPVKAKLLSSHFQQGEDKKSSTVKPDETVRTLAVLKQLQELLQIPFLLKIFADSLPALEQQKQDLNQLNRFLLYEIFMQQWFERNRDRLAQTLGQPVSTAQCEGFLRYSQQLAVALFKAKQVQVNYAPGISPWDDFFSQDNETVVRLRSGCPLRRVSDQYSFIHKSFYEFFLAQHIIHLAITAKNNLTLLIEILRTRTLIAEPQVLLFLYQARQADKLTHPAIESLLAVIRHSRSEPDIATASANAATILNACHINLGCQDWRGVQLPGADLSYCVLAHSNLKGANLRGAILARAMLYQANLQGAELSEVQWGEHPYLQLKEKIISFVAHHPQEPWFAVAQNNQIIFINRDTGKRIGRPMHHKSNKRVTGIAFSPDGLRIASADNLELVTDSSDDNCVRLWDIRTRKLLGETPGQCCVAFSPNGLFIASGGIDQTILIHEARSLKLLGKMYAGDEVNSLSFNCDSSLLVSAAGKKASLWKVTSREQLAIVSEHKDGDVSVAFSPDGLLVASSSCYFYGNDPIRLWNVKNQKLHSEIPVDTAGVASITFSPDGSCLVVGGKDKTIRLFDVVSQKPRGEMHGHKTKLFHVTFSPDGSYLISASYGGEIRLWNFNSQKLRGDIRGHTTKVIDLAFDADASYLVSTGYDTARLWDFNKQKLLDEIPINLIPKQGDDHNYYVALSSDGSYLATSFSNKVQLWDVKNRQLLGNIPLGDDHLTSIAFNHDGSYLAFSKYNDDTLQVWETKSQHLLSKIEKKATGYYYITKIGLSPNGLYIAVLGSESYNVQLWHTKDQQLLGKFGCSGSYAACFTFSSRSDLLAIGNLDGMVMLWDIESQESVANLKFNHKKVITSLVFAPDSSHLAVASNDWTVYGLPSGANPNTKVQIWKLSEQKVWEDTAAFSWPGTIYEMTFAPYYKATTIPDTKCDKEKRWASSKGNLLAIADTNGILSLWLIPNTQSSPRLLDMPKHPLMPLWLEEARLDGCRMTQLSRRLLDQHNANISTVVVVDDPVHKESKEIKHHSTSTAAAVTSHFATSSPVSSKVTTLAVLIHPARNSTALFSSRPSPVTVTRPSARSTRMEIKQTPVTVPRPADSKMQDFLNEICQLIDTLYPPFNPTHMANRKKYIKQVADYLKRIDALTVIDRKELKNMQTTLVRCKEEQENLANRSTCILS